MGLVCPVSGGAGWLGMGLMWLVLLAVVVWAVARLFPTRTRRDPRQVLDARLAAGDLDPETYRALREELDRPAAPVPGDVPGR